MRKFDRNQDDCENGICASLQFLRLRKNQIIKLQGHLERYCYVLPVFGLKSAKIDLNSIKSYLLPNFVNGRDIETTVIKKSNQFIKLKLGGNQLLDILNFHGGATSLGSILKAYKTSKTKGSFPCELFDHPDNLQNTEFPRKTRFTVNVAAVTLWKQNTKSLLIY